MTGSCEILWSDLAAKMDGMVREDHFVITVASEIMAVLMSGRRYGRFEKRSLGRIIVAYNL